MLSVFVHPKVITISSFFWVNYNILIQKRYVCRYWYEITIKTYFCNSLKKILLNKTSNFHLVNGVINQDCFSIHFSPFFDVLEINDYQKNRKLWYFWYVDLFLDILTLKISFYFSFNNKFRSFWFYCIEHKKNNSMNILWS